MSILDEQYRLHYFRQGELPPGLYSTLVIGCDDPDDCITKIVSVMESILEYDSDYWPDDSFWQEKLPEWLLKTFKTYTPSELSEIRSDRSRWTNLPWTFGSWLDRMREREWHWWSLDNRAGKITIHVTIDGYPGSTKALEHLVTAAGGRLL